MRTGCKYTTINPHASPISGSKPICITIGLCSFKWSRYHINNNLRVMIDCLASCILAADISACAISSKDRGREWGGCHWCNISNVFSPTVTPRKSASIRGRLVRLEVLYLGTSRTLITSLSLPLISSLTWQYEQYTSCLCVKSQHYGLSRCRLGPNEETRVPVEKHSTTCTPLGFWSFSTPFSLAGIDSGLSKMRNITPVCFSVQCS